MAKRLLQTIREGVELYRCDRTGIAWVEDGNTGNGHSCHPNIDASGSVSGMKKLGYWGKFDLTKTSHGYTYNVSVCAVHDDLDEIARQHCRCGGNHTLRKPRREGEE